jgi:transcriptional regulator with XRE-family HTH domain
MSLTRNVTTQLVGRRLELGLTRKEATRLWGYCKATVERLESGKSRWLSLDKLAEYADALGMDVEVNLKERDGFALCVDGMELNVQQYRASRFIKKMERMHGRLPKLDELMGLLGVRTTGSARRCLLRLKDHGLITDQDVQTILKGV